MEIEFFYFRSVFTTSPWQRARQATVINKSFSCLWKLAIPRPKQKKFDSVAQKRLSL